MKKLLIRSGLAAGTLGLVIAGAAAFSAFEAHVVNVTARIENGLLVDTTPINFGTVFPQEYLTHNIEVKLSDSFLDAGRVDDVEYVIKQKPKVKQPCRLDAVTQGPSVLDLALGIKTAQAQTAPCDPNANPTPGDPYAIIHVTGLGNNNDTFDGPAWEFCEKYLPENAPYNETQQSLLNNVYWNYCYLPLANSLSKHETTTDGTGTENDTSVDAFHQAYLWSGSPLQSSLNPNFIAKGRLVHSTGDTADSWTIDLKVPCFVNQCAQEASDPNNDVNDHTPGFYVPNDFRLPTSTEHSVFGTDLWIEVTGISQTGGLCKAPDVALVLDKSGSIGTDLPTLQSAANALVDALNISDPGAHGAEVSFADGPTLDQELTASSTLLHIAINNLTLDGSTDITGAINTAVAELASIRDRADITSPDFIILITDGEDTVSGNAAAQAAATAAKAAGITIYIVGVGSGVNQPVLESMASGADHYFPAANFSDLENILKGLANCD